MNKDLYSNTEFTELKNRINAEILRRGGFKWYDPLSAPKIGQDRTSPMSIPDIGQRVPVDDKTYTINTPSEGSIERTRNITYPHHSDNPGGGNSTFISTKPSTSAAALTVEELKNMIVGLTKIQDINLFYGRDEKSGIAFRDPQAIEDLLTKAEQDKLNEQHKATFAFKLVDGDLILESYLDDDIHAEFNDDGDLIITYEDDTTEILQTFKFEYNENNELLIIDQNGVMCFRVDPNNGIINYQNPSYPDSDVLYEYPVQDGYYVMPSGERDGEEMATWDGLGVNNFFDDYGAAPGDGNHHPFNPATTTQTRRDWYVYDTDRKGKKIIVVQGGIKAASYGQNPRNPNMGNEYKAVPVFKGVPGTCVGQCTGLCYQTCDSQCSESCSVSCFGRCGNACTSNCGNVCTGCSTMCYSSCRTKCENSTGYACVKSGAQSVKIYSTGGHDGTVAQNHIDVTTHMCQGCSFSCQFYPNKKTECWDAGCMGKCFISCNASCSDSCMGGCINNTPGQDKGRGCSAGCTINCSGTCQNSCEGTCDTTCFNQCKELCHDNCNWTCSTTCGAGCDTGCKNGCTGCDGTCESFCTGESDMHGCTGCSTQGGCVSTCQNDCNQNCINVGCRSMCGIDQAGACSNNCRISCAATSCTSMCSDQCTDQCTNCINTCGFQCGACSSLCSTGCESECNITCTATCEQSCETNCVNSCSEECGACSKLCYSCVGMCIGICSVKCDGNCSSCSNQCGWWCDTQCNQTCFSNCDDSCMVSCSGTCATFVGSEANLPGPERGPTVEGYQPPTNRNEEQESFRLIKEDKDD